MSIATDLLSFFRTEWADRLTDTCVVKRETGESFSDVTGVSTPTYTTNYSGPCLVRPVFGPREAGDELFGQELLQTRRYVVHVPYTEADQLPGDLVDITSVTDSFLTGKQFVVMNVPGDTLVTNRGLICEEVVSG